VSAGRARTALAVLGLLAAVAAGEACAGRRWPEDGVASGAGSFGVYRGSLRDPSGRNTRFRVLLFADRPDRLHAEVLGPGGSPALILDGGEGRISVTVVGENVCYSGPSGAEAMESVLGIRTSVDALVGAFLAGEVREGAPAFMRDPETAEGLPRTFEIRSGTRVLRLERASTRALRPSESLGTGNPTPGMTVRPLAELQVAGGGALVDGGAPPP
jgi:hypothetical protein